MAKKEPVDAEKPAEDGAPKRGGKKKLIIMVLPVLVVLLAVGFFLKGRAGDSSAAAAPPPPAKGKVVPVADMFINLADGHYLKLGLALQATADAGEAFDTAEASDVAIALLTNRPMKDIATDKGREAFKKELVKRLSETYEKKVMDVYFTAFVTQ